MKIVQLNAENIKRLVAVEIRPEGNVVEITGMNAQGKTSILDAIYWALETNKVVQSKPVREGAESGFVKLDLGDYVVTKKFRVRDGGEVTISLTVENKDGAKFGNPQDLLNGFIGDLTFDPLAFARMKPRDQLLALRSLVPGFDFAAADQSNKDDFEDRTVINRTIRDLKARIDAIHIPEGTPNERISSEDLMAELQGALEHNANVDRVTSKRENISLRISSLEDAIISKREMIRSLEVEISQCELDIEELRDEEDGVPAAGEKIDIDPIRLRIRESEEINRHFESNRSREGLKLELSQAEEKSAAFTKSIEDRKLAADKAVREAKLPVSGLSMTEDEILLNGQPFAQGSDAEQLRVSIAVAGAMNPRLRIVRVRDGSLLDDSSIAALTEYAAANDLQVWIETVQSGRKAAVVIEDGRVAGSEGGDA